MFALLLYLSHVPGSLATELGAIVIVSPVLGDSTVWGR